MDTLRNSRRWWMVVSVAFFVTLPSLSAHARVGALEALVSVVALVLTLVFVWAAARYVWVPLIRRTGIWVSAAVLIGALVAVIAVIVLIAAGAPEFTRRLLTDAAVTGLLFSWAYAALSCASAPRNS